MLFKILGTLFVVSVLQVSIRAGPQVPLSAFSNELVHDEVRLNTSVNYVETIHLSSMVSTEDYTVLKHPRHRGHSVRIKKTEFCDSTVKYVLFCSQ